MTTPHLQVERCFDTILLISLYIFIPIFKQVFFFFDFLLPQLFDYLLWQLLFYILLNFFQCLPIKNNLLFFKLMCGFYRSPTSNHHIKTSILKFKMPTSVAFSPNSILLLLLSIKLILKLNKLFKDVVVNEKRMCFLLFIFFCSSNVVLIYLD